MQRQEVHGRCGWSWSSVVVQHPEWIREKTISVLVQVPTRHANLTNVPLAPEVAKSDDDRQAIEFLFGHLVMSRSYVLPPDVPAERTAALRAGFDAMVKDKDVIADFASQTGGTGVRRRSQRTSAGSMERRARHRQGAKAIAGAKRWWI
jgi:hypothetical protein